MTRNAREKLNSIYLGGAICIGALVGLIGQSWPLFLFVTGVLIAADMAVGNIRPSGRK
jgi:hypothetical protein